MEILPRLQEIQHRRDFLPKDELERLSAESGVSTAELISIASFYGFFCFERLSAPEHIERPYTVQHAGAMLSPAKPYRWDAIAAARERPNTIITQIERAGLLGRSGGAFPVWKKWSITANTPATEKYVVCNADEGEPYTGKDRALLERNPWAVLEGMAVCAAAVGARKGYIYLRGEYADLHESVQAAIDAAPLGDFSVELRLGSGSYVCGEETALIASLESRRGETSLKPPYPGMSGLYGAPTVVNNVETFACVSEIFKRGADFFRGIGEPDYPGIKLYTVSGCVKNPGVYEFPSGITAAQLLKAAGGIVDGGSVQAILCGGGSGSLLRPDCVDMVMTPRGCAEKDAVFGVASLHFISQNESVLEFVRGLTEFFARESCGMCVPCRIGLQRLSELLCCEPNGEKTSEIKTLCRQIRESSRCALGQAAVTPVLTALERFPEVME